MKILANSKIGPYRVGLEFKYQDLWVGAYWDKSNLWICLVPMFPIHFERKSNE